MLGQASFVCTPRAAPKCDPNERHPRAAPRHSKTFPRGCARQRARRPSATVAPARCDCRHLGRKPVEQVARDASAILWRKARQRCRTAALHSALWHPTARSPDVRRGWGSPVGGRPGSLHGACAPGLARRRDRRPARGIAWRRKRTCRPSLSRLRQPPQMLRHECRLSFHRHTPHVGESRFAGGTLHLEDDGVFPSGLVRVHGILLG